MDWVPELSKRGKKVTKIIHVSLCFVNVCAVWPAVSISCRQDFPYQNRLNPVTLRKKIIFEVAFAKYFVPIAYKIHISKLPKDFK